MFIYGPLNGIFRLISLVLLVVEVIAVVDAAIRPASSYEVAGKQSKTFWVVILVLAVLLRGVGILGIAGLIAAIVYLVDVRPAIRDVSGGRGSQGGWRT